MIIFHKFYLYKFYTCSSGTLILAPSACRTKPIGLGSPKRTNSLCGKLPHKKALLRAVPCTGITKPCGCQVRDMAKPIPPHPKVDNTLDGHCPQKRLFVGRFFTHSTSCLSALGSQARTVLFSRTSMGRLYKLYLSFVLKLHIKKILL